MDTSSHRCISIKTTQPYPPSHHLSSIPFAEMYKKWGMYLFFLQKDWERNNKKHFRRVEIRNDILIYINIKLVFQMEIDYTRC